MSALLVWLELGLSIPKFELPNRNENDTVREGGPSLQCKLYFLSISNLSRVYQVPRDMSKQHLDQRHFP